VRIDGRDLREVTLESLGRHVGVVFQDTFLWHTSIRDNLLYARPEATEQELEAAARAAHLHEFASSLPDGYDTVVGERGHRLARGDLYAELYERQFLVRERERELAAVGQVM